MEINEILKTLEEGGYLEDSFDLSGFLFYLINLNKIISIEEAIKDFNEVNRNNLFRLEKEILSLNKEINIKSEKNKLKKSLYENLVDEIRSKNLELAFRYNKLNFLKKLFIRIKIINYPQEILELNNYINFITKKLNSLNKKIKSLENEIILSKENKKKLQETVLKIKDLEKFSN